MQLTSFADACWGAQFGNAIPEGTPIELFKFRSLSGYVICHSGGPVAWRAIRQDRTAQSSCEAEIYATNECVKDTLALKHIAADLHMPDGSQCTRVYNDNEACVAWSASVTNKGTKHFNLRENYVREAHQFQEVNVLHIPGQINPSDLFTKKLKMLLISDDFAIARWCRGPTFSSTATRFPLTFPMIHFPTILCQHLSQLTMLSLELPSAFCKTVSDSLHISLLDRGVLV